MRATIMHGAEDACVERVPDARLIEQADAIVRVTRAMNDRGAIKVMIEA